MDVATMHSVRAPISWYVSAGSSPGRKPTEIQQPNDETEQDRMDLVHHLYGLLLGGKLFLAPVPDDTQRVLDLGTGTGIWAMDFAEFVFLKTMKNSSSC